MSEYWIKYKKCPICESEIQRSISPSNFDHIFCKNGCFGEIRHGHTRQCSIFNTDFSCDMRFKDSIQFYVNKAVELISYYREDYRYVAEILERR